MSDVIELNDEELEKVSGGFTKNVDGSFTFAKDEIIHNGGIGNIIFKVLETKTVTSLKDKILVEKFKGDESWGQMYKDADFLIDSEKMYRGF